MIDVVLDSIRIACLPSYLKNSMKSPDDKSPLAFHLLFLREECAFDMAWVAHQIQYFSCAMMNLGLSMKSKSGCRPVVGLIEMNDSCASETPDVVSEWVDLQKKPYRTTFKNEMNDAIALGPGMHDSICVCFDCLSLFSSTKH